MSRQGGSTTFGRRSESHTVIIARGDKIRHFTVEPWVATVAGCAVAALAIGYLAATSYLVLRDDLISATVARQARMQHAYEDRISALRAQVDRITSRQMLDQRLVESKVTELLDRQSKLSERNGQIGPLVDLAAETSETPTAEIKTSPDVKAEIAPSSGDPITVAESTSLWAMRDRIEDSTGTAADRADKLFVAINQSLRSIEAEQMDKVSDLANDAYLAADTISQVLADAGLPLDADFGRQAVGGPLVPIDPSDAFDAKVRELDEALMTLDSVKAGAARLPIANPAPGRAVTSTFGRRRDPLLGTLAMHSGMDFRSGVGSPVRATGAGKVVHAGFNGGYGRVVEISHGDGITTRYAHMSVIHVHEGQTVGAGDLLGKSGNSGRSTGPHLHYEVRRNGEATNPLPFIKIGRKIGQYLIRS